MKQLKIRKDLWDLILKGEKKYEFRKLEKGYATGTYEFISIENKSDIHCQHCLGFPSYINGVFITDENHDLVIECKSTPKEVYGNATLTPIANPDGMEDSDNGLILYSTKTNLAFNIGDDYTSYYFVKENYIDKGIDFVVYEISDVKGVNNGTK